MKEELFLITLEPEDFLLGVKRTFGSNKKCSDFWRAGFITSKQLSSLFR